MGREDRRHGERPPDDPDDALPRAHERAQRDAACGSTGRATWPRPATRCPRSSSTSPSATRAGLFDSSPLYKYRIHGRGRGALPGRRPRPRHPDLPAGPRPVHALVRRPRLRRRGRRHPPPRPRTSSCSPRPSRTSPTSSDLVGRLDVGDRGGLRRLGRARRPGPALARPAGVAGPGVADAALLRARRRRRSPRSRSTSRGPATPATSASRSGSRPATRSRVWDAVWAASRGRGVIPIGMTALYMARIEAGLVLLDVDFHSSRFAWTDADRTTPIELGLGWMFRDIATDDRAFIGRDAIRRELRRQDLALEADRARRRLARLRPDLRRGRASSRPRTTPRSRTSTTSTTTTCNQLGYATSQMYSPMLQRHIALARVPLDRADAGLAGQARAGGQPPLRVLRRRTSTRTAPLQPRAKDRLTCRRRRRHPDARARREGRADDDGRGAPDRGRDASPRRPDLRRDRHRRRPQRADERRLPGEGRPADAHPRAAPPRRRARRSPRSCGRASGSPRSRTPSACSGRTSSRTSSSSSTASCRSSCRRRSARWRTATTCSSARTTARTSRRSPATATHDADAYDAFNHDVEQGPARRSSRSSTRSRPTSSATTPRSSSRWPRSARASASSTRRSSTTRSGC